MAPRRGLHLIAVVPYRTDSKQQAEVAALGQGEGWRWCAGMRLRRAY